MARAVAGVATVAAVVGMAMVAVAVAAMVAAPTPPPGPVAVLTTPAVMERFETSWLPTMYRPFCAAGSA